MDAAKSVVLVSQYKTVSPRSPISSAKYNDFVSETGADLINIKTQVNRILEALTIGADSTVIWSNDTSTIEGEHGIDAKALWWDSSAATVDKKSIFEYVKGIENDLNTLNANVETLSATDISYDNDESSISWFDNAGDQHVKQALDKIIETLPMITDENGLPTVLLSNVNVNDHFIDDAQNLHTIGSSAKPWSMGWFTNLDVASDIDIGGTLSFDGVPFDPVLTAATDAEQVTYAETESGIPQNVKDAVNVEAALDQLGLNQVFGNANQQIKRVPTTGLQGTAGMTIKEWLNEMFFPYISAFLGFDSPGLQEKGLTTNSIDLGGRLSWEDETGFTAGTFKLKIGSTLVETLSDPNLNLAYFDWTSTQDVISDTTFTIELGIDDNGTPTTISTDRAIQFYAPTYYTSGPAGLTVTQIQALALNNEKFIKSGRSGSHSFSPDTSNNTGYIYIAYPQSFNELTQITDPNGYIVTDAVGFITSDGGTTPSPNVATVPFTLPDNSVVQYYIYRWIDLTTQTNYTLTFS